MDGDRRGPDSTDCSFISGDRSHEESTFSNADGSGRGDVRSGADPSPTSDVLGAHLNYGRGCAACHAPHSGARGNGIATTDTATGDIALWGQDVAPLFGKSYTTGQSEHGGYTLTLPSGWNGSDPVTANTM